MANCEINLESAHFLHFSCTFKSAFTVLKTQYFREKCEKCVWCKRKNKNKKSAKEHILLRIIFILTIY